MFEFKVDRKCLIFDLWIAVSLITMLFLAASTKLNTLPHFFCLSFLSAMKQEIETSANLLDIQFNFIILYVPIQFRLRLWKREAKTFKCRFFLLALFYAGSTLRQHENYTKWFRFAREVIVDFLKRVNHLFSVVSLFFERRFQRTV